MSAPLNPQQFPVYEVHGKRRDKVSPEHFGFRHDPDPEWPAISGESEVRRVPLQHLVAGQDYVYRGHVKDLATIPAEHLEKHADEGLPEGYDVGSHVLVGHGHHRLAAAHVRGDKDALVRVYLPK